VHDVSQQGGRPGGNQVLNSMASPRGAEGTTMNEPQDVQDHIGNEDAHNADGPLDAIGRANALENERDRVAEDMDVEQSNSGDKGYDVAKGKGTSLRRSDRKQKMPPSPEREGVNRGKPQPASRKKAKSKEQPLKPMPKPEPGMKSNLHPDVGSIECNYFEEIQIGGATRLVDIIDLTQDMVGHLSTHKDTLY